MSKAIKTNADTLREPHASYLAGDLLLDTHAALWWFIDAPQLSVTARTAIGDGERRAYFSATSAWELTTKARIGKLPELPDVTVRLPGFVSGSGFLSLPISVGHATAAGALPGPHRDPFDRMLIAQALQEKLVVVTCDPVFAEYGCTTVW